MISRVGSSSPELPASLGSARLYLLYTRTPWTFRTATGPGKYVKIASAAPGCT